MDGHRRARAPARAPRRPGPASPTGDDRARRRRGRGRGLRRVAAADRPGPRAPRDALRPDLAHPHAAARGRAGRADRRGRDRRPEPGAPAGALALRLPDPDRGPRPGPARLPAHGRAAGAAGRPAALRRAAGGLGPLVCPLGDLGRRHGGRAALDPLPDHDGRPGDRDRPAVPRPAAGPHPALGARGGLRRGVPGGPGRDRHRPPPAHLAGGAAAGPVRGDLVLRQREQLRHLPHADAPVPRGDPALRARRAPEGGRLRREHPGAADDPDHRQQVGPDLGGPDTDRAAGDRGAGPRVARASGRCRGDRRPDRGPAGAGDARLGPAGAVAAGRDQARLRPAARADREPDRVRRRAGVAALGGPGPGRREQRPGRGRGQRRDQRQVAEGLPRRGQPAQLVARGAGERRPGGPRALPGLLPGPAARAGARRARLSRPVRALHGAGRHARDDRLRRRQPGPLDGDPLRADVDHLRPRHGRDRARPAGGPRGRGGAA